VTNLPPGGEAPRDEAREGARDDARNEEIIIECDLPEPPEKVWRALTVPELLTAWLLGEDLDPGGQRSTDRDAPRSDTLEPLSVEPQQRVRYRWSAHEEAGAGERRLESELSFELTPAAGGGTHLRIVHGDFHTSHVIRMCAPVSALRTRRHPSSCAPVLQARLTRFKWAA